MFTLIFTAHSYNDKNPQPHIMNFRDSQSELFQQCSAMLHTEHMAMEYLDQNDINSLSKSTYLNPSEHKCVGQVPSPLQILGQI